MTREGDGLGVLWCTVAAAPGAAGVRVWEVISRGRPRGGRPLPEEVDGAGLQKGIRYVAAKCLVRCVVLPQRHLNTKVSTIPMSNRSTSAILIYFNLCFVYRETR